MPEKLHWIKVSVKANSQDELSVTRRRLTTNHSKDPIVVAWSLNDANHPAVVFDATNYFTWIDPIPPGVFTKATLSDDRRRIIMDIYNPAGNPGPGWLYKLRAEGPGPNEHYETRLAEPEEDNGAGGGGKDDVGIRIPTNPIIINR